MTITRDSGLTRGKNTDVLFLSPREADVPGTGRVDRVVSSQPNVLSQTVLCPPLSDDDRPRVNPFTPKTLHSQAFPGTVVNILSRASARFMSHRYPFSHLHTNGGLIDHNLTRIFRRQHLQCDHECLHDSIDLAVKVRVATIDD